MRINNIAKKVITYCNSILLCKTNYSTKISIQVVIVGRYYRSPSGNIDSFIIRLNDYI